MPPKDEMVSEEDALFSIPPATTTDARPSWISCAASAMALRPDEHTRKSQNQVGDCLGTAGSVKITFIDSRGFSGGRKTSIDGSLTGRSLP